MKRSTRSTYVRQLALGAGLLGVGLLTGCGVNLSTPSSGTNYNPPPQINGQVTNGKNNIGGSKITIYQTVNTGTVTPQGRYVGTAKVLGTTTADAGGKWTMPSNISCSSPDMIYVVAEGGKPYMGFESFTNEPNNSKMLLMTAVGDCSILNNNFVTIFTSESTTVAAVNALAPFISVNGTTVNVVSSATNYAGDNGVGTASNAAGLKHAFANANNLAPYDQGYFNSATGKRPLGQGGFISLPLVSTLAYIQYLADCGSDAGGGDYTYRDQLLSLTTPDGGSEPATTLEAMLNIAQWNYPSANAVALYTLSQHRQPHTSTPADPVDIHPPYNRSNYWPLLTGVDAYNFQDWSVAIYYPQGYGQTANGQGLSYPLYVAIDANDNVYVANAVGGTSYKGNVIAMDSAGNLLWTTDDDLDSYISPRGIAVDSKNHVFSVSNNFASPATPQITEWDATNGTRLQQLPIVTNAVGITVDLHDNVWVSFATGGVPIVEYVTDGSNNFTAKTFTIPPVPTEVLGQISVDPNQNIWAASNTSTNPNHIYFLPNTGTVDAPAYDAALQSIATPGTINYGVAIDKNGVAWSGTTSGVYNTTVSGSGASATLATSLVGSTGNANPRQGQIDGIGAFWSVTNNSSTPLYRFTPGAAAAVPYYPCYADQTTYNPANTTAAAATGSKTNIQCTRTNNVTTAANLGSKLDLAIDSTGSVWTTGANYAYVAQILGVAAPAWPLLSSGKRGVMP